MANDLWPGLLCRGDDAHGGPTLRHGSLRRRLQSQSPSVRRHDRGGNADQQDGSSSAQGQKGWEGGTCRHHERGTLKSRPNSEALKRQLAA